MKILSFILILIFSWSPVFAHSCATFKNLSDKEHSEKLKEVDSIFEGELILSTNLGNHSYLNTYKVSRVWKGDITTEITVKVDNPCGVVSGTEDPIGAPVKIAKAAKILIYGYAIKNQPLINVNCCNFGLFDDKRMKQEYGDGITIEQPRQNKDQTPTQSFGEWIWKKLFSFFS